jgi:hypothetical protein
MDTDTVHDATEPFGTVGVYSKFPDLPRVMLSVLFVTFVTVDFMTINGHESHILKSALREQVPVGGEWR